ncbi:heparin lyase I family protein [Flavobacterium sp. WC2509]|uniref:heparin lyase I family protein n=1 Tax=Flavobacterium sp. WC2509 TaxID=3461406 RepID=UPI004043D435
MNFKQIFLLCVAIFATAIGHAQVVTNTVFTADYENGTTNSGNSGIDPTHATAADAISMVQPGATGAYAIGHTIKFGNPAYISDGYYRSESSTIDAYQYFPGEERRYEVSIKMQDWPAWTTTDPLYGIVLFQLKMSDGVGEPLRVIAQRNQIQSRRDIRDANGQSVRITGSLVDNYRPSVNQWMHFRIDVKWATDATGYIKLYAKLPTDTDYVLKEEQNNIVTFVGDPAVGNIGYLKWGVYTQEGNPGAVLENSNLVFTAHHDNIKVYELNHASIPKLLWSNPISNASGNSTINFTSPITTGNTTNTYIENDGSTVPNFFYSGAPLIPSNLSNRVTLNGWTAGLPTTPSPLDLNQYFEFKIAPKSGYRINFANFQFTSRHGNTTSPLTYVMRSSKDNFTSNIAPPVTLILTANDINQAVARTADLSTLQDIDSPITIRMYWYGNTAGTTNRDVGINDFAFNGNIVLKPITLDVKTHSLTNELNVIVTPNPTKTVFKINITGNSSQTVFVDVFDILGRSVSSIKTNADQTITIGNDLIPGIYLAKITQDKKTKTMKLIKQ